MHYKISAFKYGYNAILAFFVTPILALVVAVMLSSVLVWAANGLRYQRTSFANFEKVWVTDERTDERLGGDFSLHPELFERDGENYSAEINGRMVEFTRNWQGYSDALCDAAIEGESAWCEELSYFSDPSGFTYYVRLTGDLNLTRAQAVDLSAPHWRFDELTDRIYTISAYLIPFGMFYLIRRVIRWNYRSRVVGNQLFGLYLPWATGLLFWTFWRVILGG